MSLIGEFLVSRVTGAWRGIHYVDEGTCDALLLLHGNPSWSFLYRKIIAALRGDFRCVALDFPGYGLSDAAPDYLSPQHSKAAYSSASLIVFDCTT